jgi:hypothetical protein
MKLRHKAQERSHVMHLVPGEPAHVHSGGVGFSLYEGDAGVRAGPVDDEVAGFRC